MENLLKEQAEAYADRIDDGIRTARQCAISAYLAGAANAQKALWHPADEVPSLKGKCIVGLTLRGHHFKYTTSMGAEKWHTLCKTMNIERWTYKENLI